MSTIFELFGVEDEAPVVPAAAPPRTKAAAPKPAVPAAPKPSAPKPAAPKPAAPAVVVAPAAPVVAAVVVAPAAPVGEGSAKPRKSIWYLDCGHLNWKSAEENAAAEARGHCCANGEQNHQFSWKHLKGKFVRPLPPQIRRSFDREQMGGFPGYCCDDNGFYIGGIGNNCQHHSPDARRCIVHRGASKSPRKAEPAPEPEAVEAVEVELDGLIELDDLEVGVDPRPETPAPRPSGGSWKQRQMSARRGGRK
jgi:hypothetical protein